jgi:hypothetical protein
LVLSLKHWKNIVQAQDQANWLYRKEDVLKIRLQIANTIIGQLGGRRFKVMTGARDFLALDSGVSFRLPAFPGVQCNAVRVVLEASDTYTVEFLRVWGRSVKSLSVHSDIYAEDLSGLFERETGLRVSL